MKTPLSVIPTIILSAAPALSEPLTNDAFERISETTFGPVIEAHDIPGIAIGLTYRGETYFHTHGLAVQDPPQPVTVDTLFELGSVSKLFNVTLASLAEERGLLSLDRAVSEEMPVIQGSAFDTITLNDLAAHANGGLPLQVPASIRSEAELTQWLANWTTDEDPRRIRSYSNLSIGLLGKITAEAFDSDYETALATELLSELGLNHTFVSVPDSEMVRYAYGYNRFGNAPSRVELGYLDAEAYGIKATVADMIQFLNAHLGSHSTTAEVGAALLRTRMASYDTEHYAQAMVWEAYPWPVTAEELTAGNSREMAFVPQPITVRENSYEDMMFFNKTGGTIGFSAYVAMVPSEGLGVVVLANRNYPNPVRAVTTLELMAEILNNE